MNKIKLHEGDITKVEADAIVNAANSSLLGGGGVDGAIHRVGGNSILEDCLKIRARQGGCPTGEAVITTAGNLNARFVIHTVGPIWNDHKKEKNKKLLQNCYFNSLNLAVVHQVETIAFPNISTGIYRFPKEAAAQVAISTVTDFLKKNESIKEVVFVCYDSENYQIYSRMLRFLNQK